MDLDFLRKGVMGHHSFGICFYFIRCYLIVIFVYSLLSLFLTTYAISSYIFNFYVFCALFLNLYNVRFFPILFFKNMWGVAMPSGTFTNKRVILERGKLFDF